MPSVESSSASRLASAAPRAMSLSDILVEFTGSYERWGQAVLDSIEKDPVVRRDQLLGHAQVRCHVAFQWTR